MPPGFLYDRGTKHPAKPLAAYLSNRPGLLAIRAGYTNAGQAERSVRSLLNATSAPQARAVYLIGVGHALLDEVWKRSLPARDNSDLRSPNHQAARDLRSILEQYSSEEVPAALLKAYLGNSTEAEVVRRLIVRAARVDHPVLVQGETGTGKEVVARQIHLLSTRAAESFVEVNCGGIPAELLESELFGHKKGAFTGATRNKPGLWTMADRGTLFLDEIGDLSPHHQVKILRALETGRYRPVGEVGDVASRARIIAATNRDLAHMVSSGQFREDLYYRLFTFRIRTPALREHPEDIHALVNHFWHRIAGSKATPIPGAVSEALKTYHWPGNVRELRAFLINVFLLVDQRLVDVTLIRAVMQDRLGYAIQVNSDR